MFLDPSLYLKVGELLYRSRGNEKLRVLHLQSLQGCCFSWLLLRCAWYLEFLRCRGFSIVSPV